MAFVNEYISEADIENYKIEESNRKYNKHTSKPSWTVDHERRFYLRLLHRGREEYGNRLTYIFYWNSSEIIVYLDVDGGGVVNGSQWRHYRLFEIKIPEIHLLKKTELINDLKEALVAYRGAGVRSTSDPRNFSATFDF